MALITNMFVLICVMWVTTTTHGLDSSEYPAIACPDVFRYQQTKNELEGIITLRNVPFTTLNIDVDFLLKEHYTANYLGTASFEPDSNAAQKSLEDGSPISLKVTFPPTKEVPQLIRISLNAKEICSTDIPIDPEKTLSIRASLKPVGDKSLISNGSIATLLTEEHINRVKIDSALCGISTFNAANMSLGQRDAVWGWFPWAARIYRLKDFSPVTSGILISARTIITAAHPFDRADPNDIMLVHLGTLGLNDVIDSYPVTCFVKSLLTLPEYGRTTYSDADIALLLLDRYIEFNSYIFPICLWDQPDESVVGEQAFVSYFSYNGPDQAMNATVIGQSECLQSSRGYIQTLSSRTLCAKYYNVSSGPRHSSHTGSGLILNRDGLWRLRGIFSACLLNNGRCNEKLYFVYNDVAKYLPWIRENMWT